MTGWQPIETAPKNGLPTLCLHPDWALPTWCVWSTDIRGHAEGRWYECDEQEWLEPQPTHWMSIPAPPDTGPMTPKSE